MLPHATRFPRCVIRTISLPSILHDSGPRPSISLAVSKHRKPLAAVCHVAATGRFLTFWVQVLGMQADWPGLESRERALEESLHCGRVFKPTLLGGGRPRRAQYVKRNGVCVLSVALNEGKAAMLFATPCPCKVGFPIWHVADGCYWVRTRLQNYSLGWPVLIAIGCWSTAPQRDKKLANCEPF